MQLFEIKELSLQALLQTDGPETYGTLRGKCHQHHPHDRLLRTGIALNTGGGIRHSRHFSLYFAGERSAIHNQFLNMEHRILLVDTAYPINTRNIRIVDSLREVFGNDNVKVATWNRNRTPVKADDAQDYILDLPSVMGNRVDKLKKLGHFRRFLKETLREYAPTVVIASHWDSLLLCAGLRRGAQTLIYENLDMPTGRPLLYKTLRLLERRALRQCAAITFASRFYKPYYEFFKGKQIILENKIPKGFEPAIKHKAIDDPKLTIGFAGGLRYAEIFRQLFEAVKGMDNVEVVLFGGGCEANANAVKDYARGLQNVRFMGPYVYSYIPEIYKQIDLVWAVYPAKDINVRNAISNKFHESLFFQVPGFFAEGTHLGELVRQHGIGYTVDGYSTEDIRNCILGILRDKRGEIEEKRRNIAAETADEDPTWSSAVRPLIEYIAQISSGK